MVEKATLPSEEMVRYMYKLYQKNARERGDDSWDDNTPQRSVYEK